MNRVSIALRGPPFQLDSGDNSCLKPYISNAKRYKFSGHLKSNTFLRKGGPDFIS